jgi:hypothetical protein
MKRENFENTNDEKIIGVFAVVVTSSAKAHNSYVGNLFEPLPRQQRECD